MIEELIPTPAGQVAALEALDEIKHRSFSGRHPELGKMINCPVCDLRHRSSQICEQRFAVRGGLPLIAGQTPETETVLEVRKIRQVMGARPFKGRRMHPPLNKRQNQFVQLVRELLPDEYTEDDMKKARATARRILSGIYGRYGFLPPIWQRKNNEKENSKVSL